MLIGVHCEREEGTSACRERRPAAGRRNAPKAFITTSPMRDTGW